MNRFALIEILAAAALAAGASQTWASSAPLVGDSHTSSTSTSSNYGTKTSLEVVGPPAATTIKNTFLQFDLAQLPLGTIGADVSKATIVVFANTISTTGSLDVVRVTSSWSEATLTGGSAPSLGAVEVSGVSVGTSDKDDYKVVDVTQLVRDWIDGVLPNNGVALVANAGTGLNAKFDSKENTKEGHDPRLDITLVTGAAAGPPTMRLAEFGPFSVNGGAGFVAVGSGIPVAAGSYLVSAAVNLVNDSAFDCQLACLIGPDTSFGVTQHMRTSLPPLTAPGGAGHVTVVTAGTLPTADTVHIVCINDTPTCITHVENISMVVTEVQGVGF